jgi:hypothetical protein
LQQINLLNQADTKRRDRALNQKDKQNTASFIMILYTADVFITNVSTADVFTTDAAGPKERKL